MKVCSFTKREIEYCLEECNFTDQEETLFRLRCRDVPLERCAEEMSVSVATVKRISRRMKDKILRVC
ncbi:MAG: hypothetical protein K2L07_11150 [Lachnospiraceae bacterium]|nr:hypothetical protein [Lachnospiraceae bacterium]